MTNKEFFEEYNMEAGTSVLTNYHYGYRFKRFVTYFYFGY